MLVLLALFALGGVAMAEASENPVTRADIQEVKDEIQLLRAQRDDVKATLQAAKAVIAELVVRKDAVTDKDVRRDLKAKLAYERGLRDDLKVRLSEIKVVIYKMRVHVEWLKQQMANA